MASESNYTNTFVPLGAQIKCNDYFPLRVTSKLSRVAYSFLIKIIDYFLACPFSGEDKHNVKKVARSMLFAFFTTSELIKRRIVCKEWKTEIEHILQTEPNHILFFSSRYNFNEYLSFTKKTGFVNDSRFQVKTYNSHKSIVLFCTDIEALLRTSFLFKFKQVTSVTYFGCSPEQKWHLHIKTVLGSLLKITQVKSLTLNRYGYFNKQHIIQDSPDVFGALESIHLVQPSQEETLFWTKFQFNENFVFAGGQLLSRSVNETMKNLSSIHLVSKTKVFVYQLVPYNKTPLVDRKTGFITPESYI